MWSDQYYYFLIQSGDNYSEVIQSDQLKEFLINELHLLQKGADSFEGESHHPWLQVAMVNAQADGSFSTQNICPEYINLVSVIGSKANDREYYVNLLIKLASWLKWDLIEEEDDDGNENIVLWSSTQSI